MLVIRSLREYNVYNLLNFYLSMYQAVDVIEETRNRRVETNLKNGDWYFAPE
jgi:hypothetical protein